MSAVESFRIPPPILRASSDAYHAPLEKVFPHTFPLEENFKWLTTYEQLEGSIFKYYNVQNEIAFLKNVEGLSDERKDYYLQENVKRFLGEFVGKVPYTTIPYEVDEMGILYAGMRVRESYQKAAEKGGEREIAEIKGFSNIEETYMLAQHKKNNKSPTCVWISPPKIADYGFVFVFAPDSNGNIKEYILRYPERMSELTKSKSIYSVLSPSSPPQNTDSFLTQPLFDRYGSKPQAVLDSVMKEMNISSGDIQKSHEFENAVNLTLEDWINSYTSLVKSLATYESTSPLYELGVIQAKKKLLAIYQKAEEIKNEIDNQQVLSFIPLILTSTAQLSVEELNYSAAALQSTSNLPTTSEGSCPAIADTETSSFTTRSTPLSNWDIVKGILNGKTPESLTVKERYDDYECPKCQTKIRGELVGKPETWTKTCQKCGCMLQCAH